MKPKRMSVVLIVVADLEMTVVLLAIRYYDLEYWD